MLLAQTLHYWASLLKFAERCGMKPNILIVWFHLAAQYAQSLAFSLPQFLYLIIKQACYGNAKKVDVDYYIIHKAPLTAPEGASIALVI